MKTSFIHMHFLVCYYRTLQRSTAWNFDILIQYFHKTLIKYCLVCLLAILYFMFSFVSHIGAADSGVIRKVSFSRIVMFVLFVEFNYLNLHICVV